MNPTGMPRAIPHLIAGEGDVAPVKQDDLFDFDCRHFAAELFEEKDLKAIAL
jgi:hypothetical protein